MKYLQNLFSLYDEMYFESQLSKITQYYSLSFGWMPISQKSTGRFVIDGNQVTILISERCKGSEALLLNTMVHEMIHLKQRLKCTIHSDRKYLDGQKIKGSKLWQNKGHGHYFLTWAGILNEKHDELNITVKDTASANSDFSLENAIYVASVVFRDNRTRLFLSSKPVLNLEELYYQAQEIFGRESVASIQTYRSNSSVGGIMTGLTSKALIPTGIRKAANLDEHVQRFLNHNTTELLSEFSVDRVYKNEISKAFQDSLTNPKFMLISYASFADFIYHVAVHTSDWEDISFDSGVDILTRKHRDVINDMHLEHAFDYWQSCPTHSIVKHLHNRTGQKYIKEAIQSNDVAYIAKYMISIIAHAGGSRLTADAVSEHMLGIHIKPSNKHLHRSYQEIFKKAAESANTQLTTFSDIVKANHDWILMTSGDFYDHVITQAANNKYDLESTEVKLALTLQDNIVLKDIMSSEKTKRLLNAVLEDVSSYLGARTSTAKNQFKRNLKVRISDGAELFKLYANKSEVENAIWEECINIVYRQAPKSSRSQIIKLMNNEIRY